MYSVYVLWCKTGISAGSTETEGCYVMYYECDCIEENVRSIGNSVVQISSNTLTHTNTNRCVRVIWEMRFMGNSENRVHAQNYWSKLFSFSKSRFDCSLFAIIRRKGNWRDDATLLTFQPSPSPIKSLFAKVPFSDSDISI